MRLGFFDDFGIIATESAALDALRALTASNDILGFELKVLKSEWGTKIEFLGVTVTFLTVGMIVRAGCQYQSNLEEFGS